MSSDPSVPTPAFPEPRRFVGHRTAAAASLPSTSSSALVPASTSSPKRIIRQTIPDSLLHDEQLNRAISVLPSNYNFEIHKTIWRIRQANATRIALQFPEGLQMYACTISDILEAYVPCRNGRVPVEKGGEAQAEAAEATETKIEAPPPPPPPPSPPVRCIILGDVTYGACCVDDYSAMALGCDFLVHYGHSCLVPVDVSRIPCMYVFVDILVDLDHFIETVKLNFPNREAKLVLAGTIQFATSMAAAREQLVRIFPLLRVPQCKPLSPGEVLGCTAPVLTEPADAIVFLADGRFHLESLMIANPSIPAYRYDPYGRIFTHETYDQRGMRAVRRAAIERAATAMRWGVILGTLGRQGNPRILDTLLTCLRTHGREEGAPPEDISSAASPSSRRTSTLPRAVSVFLMSEIQPTKLAKMPEIEAWVQIACPRLSIDWGEGFHVPVLTPYEAMSALGAVPRFWEDGKEDKGSSPRISAYPMDYYAKEGGEWSSSYLRKGSLPPRTGPAALGG